MNEMQSRAVNPDRISTTEAKGPLPDPAASAVARAAAQTAAEASWGRNHFINIRLSIPLVFTRVYVTLVAGKERRDDARRRAERQKHPLRTWGNMFLFGYSGALFGLALFALIVIATVFAVTHLFEIDITLR
jgi:hypothetical protein